MFVKLNTIESRLLGWSANSIGASQLSNIQSVIPNRNCRKAYSTTSDHHQHDFDMILVPNFFKCFLFGSS